MVVGLGVGVQLGEAQEHGSVADSMALSPRSARVCARVSRQIAGDPCHGLHVDWACVRNAQLQAADDA